MIDTVFFIKNFSLYQICFFFIVYLYFLLSLPLSWFLLQADSPIILLFFNLIFDSLYSNVDALQFKGYFFFLNFSTYCS